MPFRIVRGQRDLAAFAKGLIQFQLRTRGSYRNALLVLGILSPEITFIRKGSAKV